MPELHPQCVTDPDGTRRSVRSSLAKYEALLETLEDLEDREDARKAMDEPRVPWETVKADARGRGPSSAHVCLRRVSCPPPPETARRAP